jgi:hypothetical protein
VRNWFEEVRRLTAAANELAGRAARFPLRS